MDFREYIKDHLVLLDGAMGTYIYQKGVFINKCYDSLNIDNPELIRSIHQEYFDAGAIVIETNTFGANRCKLKKHNLVPDLERINREGVKIARSVVEDAGFVAGSIGPLGVEIEPFGDIVRQAAFDTFQEQARALAQEGVDLFVLETFRNLIEIEQALLAVQSVSDKAIITHMTVLEDAKTIYGISLEEITCRLSSLGVDIIGLNCVLGPKSMLDFLERMVRLTYKPISIMPNAGKPQYLDGRTFYMSTPEYFGVYTKRLIEAGARVVGGCCGTTPEHIKKMGDALAQKQTRVKIDMTPRKEEKTGTVVLPEPVPFENKSGLAKHLQDGDFVKLVEMVPPRGRDMEKHLQGARLLQENGVDAINIPDGPRASARMNGLALALTIQEKVGIETLLHYTCRDRNLLGMQSDLLGMSVLNIHNILAVTGDPPMMGDYPQATAVFDIDAIGLTQLLTNLNKGLDIGNRPIGDPTAFLVGVGVDPNSINLEREIQRFRAKVDSGAEYAITQPVFDLIQLEKFIEKVSDINIPILAGVWPLVSLRNAEFMKNEVPGVVVPDAVIETIAKYSTKEDQLKAGVELAGSMAEAVRSVARGIQVSAPFGRYRVALEVIGEIQV